MATITKDGAICDRCNTAVTAWSSHVKCDYEMVCVECMTAAERVAYDACREEG